MVEYISYYRISKWNIFPIIASARCTLSPGQRCCQTMCEAQRPPGAAPLAPPLGARCSRGEARASARGVVCRLPGKAHTTLNDQGFCQISCPPGLWGLDVTPLIPHKVSKSGGS
jgi:hypothetical protein